MLVHVSATEAEGPWLHSHDGENRTLGWVFFGSFSLLVPCVPDILIVSNPHSTFPQAGCVTSLFFIEVIEPLITQVPDRGGRVDYIICTFKSPDVGGTLGCSWEKSRTPLKPNS